MGLLWQNKKKYIKVKEQNYTQTQKYINYLKYNSNNDSTDIC